MQGYDNAKFEKPQVNSVCEKAYDKDFVRSGNMTWFPEDNIREWTGLEFTKSHKAVENKEKWRKLDAKSSVVPQQPPRLIR